MIFRTVHNKDNPYFQLDRTSVNDDRLSYKAIGIHVYLMSKPDGWEANEADISSRHTDGRAAVRSGIQELIEYGYMVRVQLRKDKKVVAWRLDTYEAPQLNPHFKPGQQAKIVTIDLDAQDLECENLNVGIQTVADLECENLQVEKLDVGNRIHSNYIDTVINESKGVALQPEQPTVSAPLPPTSSGNGFESLMGAARERANGNYGKRRDQVQIDGVQKKLEKFGIDKEQFREMVDAHLLAKGTKVLADGDGDAADRELRKAQQFVVDLCGVGQRFWERNGVSLVWDSWKANDWRGDPSEQQLLEHASQMVAVKFDKPQQTKAKPSKPFGGNSGEASAPKLRNMNFLS